MYMYMQCITHFVYPLSIDLSQGRTNSLASRPATFNDGLPHFTPPPRVRVIDKSSARLGTRVPRRGKGLGRAILSTAVSPEMQLRCPTCR